MEEVALKLLKGQEKGCKFACVCVHVRLHVLVGLLLAQQMFLWHILHNCFRNKNFHINANVFRIAVYIFVHLFFVGMEVNPNWF